jgi:hypothetical protein
MVPMALQPTMADSTQLCGEFALAPQEQQPTGSGAVIRSRYRGLSWDKKHQGCVAVKSVERNQVLANQRGHMLTMLPACAAAGGCAYTFLESRGTLVSGLLLSTQRCHHGPAQDLVCRGSKATRAS